MTQACAVTCAQNFEARESISRRARERERESVCNPGYGNGRSDPPTKKSVRVFCGALGRPPAASLAAVFDSDLPHAARLWAAYVDFVSVAPASQGEVASRSLAFLDIATSALVRAHLRPPEGDDVPRRRRARRPRPAVGAD